ncbi:hypothetical protein [Mycobacterium sp. 236(2023)]|uniref:hypothetical protein n=1 Tax=Mycobacterium sp. 236(2023) TaxID=3038163 RepID=UPI002414EFF9|nr:hypothetical protein [Mycobacterium sp. 236(2023)]MDG4667040.1 hypothetical protein [Mycobacterium sp. 236(2023)]
MAGVIVRLLDERSDLPVIGALEILALQMQQLFGTTAWSISQCTQDHDALRKVAGVDTVLRKGSGLSVMTDLGPDSYDLADYPATATALADGSSFVAAVGLDGSDPAETALLAKLGYRAVLGVGVHAGEDCFLMEFYSHDGYQHLIEIASLTRVLANYCVSRIIGTQPPHRPA